MSSEIVRNAGNVSACFDFRSLTKPPKLLSNKILIVNVFDYDQSIISTVLANYSRLRDFHSDPPYMGPLVITEKILASFINSTLIAKSHLRNICLSSSGTTIFPTTSSGVANLQTINNNPQLGPNIIILLESSIGFNFAYCRKISKAINSTSPLTLLRETADFYFWTALAISLLAVAMILKSTKKRQYDLSYYAHALVSTLLSPGTSGTFRLFRHSYLFTLWMCACITFGTYFSGSLTSFVISPTPEARMTMMSQLVESNYSLINTDSSLLTFSKEMIQSIAKPGDLIGMKVLERLNSSYVANSTEEFVNIFTRTDNTATISSWPFVIFAATRATEFIAKQAIKDVKCYIGTALVYKKNFYHVFTSPSKAGNDANKLAKALRWLMESGIYKLLLNELYEIGVSSRVQGRMRMKSPTHIVEEMEAVRSLKMEGKLQGVFYVWALCIGISTVKFGAELYWD